MAPITRCCTTNLYPTPSNLVRLGAMVQLQNEFPGVNVGLSDHTTSNLACFGAVALGATILEHHFTDRMDRPGPDIVHSMDPISLKELLISSDEIRKMRWAENCSSGGAGHDRLRICYCCLN